MSRGQAWKAVAVPITVPSGRLPATESVVLTPKSKAKHHDHVLQATMSKVQSNSNVGTDHPNIRMPCLRSHLSEGGRAGRSDGIQRNRWLVPGQIASASVSPPELGPPFAELRRPLVWVRVAGSARVRADRLCRIRAPFLSRREARRLRSTQRGGDYATPWRGRSTRSS
jgi:hypothetical protein